MSNPIEPQLSDSALLAQLHAGEPQALDLFVRRYQQTVFAVCARMLGNREEAEELAQDTFVRAIKGIRRFRGDAKLSTWLIAIAMNLCRNRRRWWARRKRVCVLSAGAGENAESVDAAQGAEGQDPGTAAQRNEFSVLLDQALLRIDARSRGLIVLRDLQGLSYEAIAEVTGMELGTVKSGLNRARLKLREQLSGLGYG